ncbi:MAG: hypothetical protein WCK42_07330 [Myxococcaceae bacterium]
MMAAKKDFPVVHLCSDGESQFACIKLNSNRLLFWNSNSKQFLTKHLEGVRFEKLHSIGLDLSNDEVSELLGELTKLQSKHFYSAKNTKEYQNEIVKIRVLGGHIYHLSRHQQMVNICNSLPGIMPFNTIQEGGSAGTESYYRTVEFIWDGIGKWQG